MLFTHSHADHIMGLDDVRPFNFRQRTRIPIFASADTMSAIQRVFHYIFDDEERQSSVPQLETHTLNGDPFDLFGLEFLPIRLLHGRSSDLRIPLRQRRLSDRSQRDSRRNRMEQLRGLDVLFLDALRHKPHPTHSTVERSIADRRAAGAAARFLHAHLPRSAARARPRAHCRRTSVSPTTAWRSTWRTPAR